MITLQFVAEANLPSWGIRYWTAGPFSHVDTVLDDGQLLGARADGGVAIRPGNYAKFSKITQVYLSARDTQERVFHTFEDAQLGKPYDHSAIWGFAANRDWRDPQKWFCSELVLAALEESQWCPPLDIPSNKVTPVSLYLIVTARGGVAKTIL